MIEDRLNRLINNEKSGGLFENYSLKNISDLLEYYNNPHLRLNAVHIAGTNGKGSIAHMLADILIKSGFKVGLYTSPHLIKINERIRINNRPIKNSDLSFYIDDLFKVTREKKIYPTYFDALTIIAFRYFLENHADLVVVETGLGGRLDSTNVISPLISIITRISYDHIHILGDSIESITMEKAGIIKPRSIVLTTNSKKSVLNIITETADRLKTSCNILNRDFKIKNIRRTGINRHSFDLVFKDLIIKDIIIKNPCAFQVENAACAISASFLLKDYGFNVPENSVKKSLSSLNIPGRFELVSENPPILFDPAHNPAAIESLIKSIKENFPQKKYIVILTIMKDKDYKSIILKIKKELPGRILYFRINDKRCLEITPEMKKKFSSLFEGIETFKSLNDLYNNIRPGKDSMIIITGSFRLYQTAKKLKGKFRRIVNFS